MRKLRDDKRQESIEGRAHQPIKGCICQSPATGTRIGGSHGRASQVRLHQLLLLLRRRQSWQFNFGRQDRLAGLAVTEQCRCDGEAGLQIHSIRPPASSANICRHGGANALPGWFILQLFAALAQFKFKAAGSLGLISTNKLEC